MYPFWREEHERCSGGWGKGEEQVAEGTGIKPEGEHEQVRELEYRGKSNMWKKRQEKNSVEGGIRRRKAGEECNGRGNKRKKRKSKYRRWMKTTIRRKENRYSERSVYDRGSGKRVGDRERERGRQIKADRSRQKGRDRQR